MSESLNVHATTKQSSEKKLPFKTAIARSFVSGKIAALKFRKIIKTRPRLLGENCIFALLFMKTVAFHTLGCKLNFAESETIMRRLAENGYHIISFREKADIYVIHSCIVTQQAEKKCIYALRQAMVRNPCARIAVMGCMSQLNKVRLQQEKSDLLLLGNTDKYNLAEILEQHPAPDETNSVAFVPAWSSTGRTRTFFKIQDGCDYFCGYCTIPYARGRSRSATISETITTLNEAVVPGCKELVLTGINIGDFGRKNQETLFQLIVEILSTQDIQRIRLSSIEPDLISDDLIRLFAENKRLMPHFHIPLQAGNDETLLAMGRKYNTALFSEKVEKIKEIIPHACIATDIITGYPGETEKNHTETLRYLERTDLSYMHVFTYSERMLTRSAKNPEQVPPHIRKQRSLELHELSEQMKHHFYTRHIGRTCEALFESEKKNCDLLGYTDNYIRVKTPIQKSLVNSVQKITITGLDADNVCTTKIY